MNETRHLYTDLAWLWPMWGDATVEYAQYCRYVSQLIQRHARRTVVTLLDIGCGGGKNLLSLKCSFQVTGLDLSPVMIAQAKQLNPECCFVQADMRSFRLDRIFDAILMDDAISHMNCRADFSGAFRTAFAHLKPGGVLIVTPDVTVETFRQNRTTASSAMGKRGGGTVEVVFVENAYDPDPSDDQYEATLIYLIREDGRLRVETDRFVLGLFSLDHWRSILTETGFALEEATYKDGEDEYLVYACIKPQ